LECLGDTDGNYCQQGTRPTCSSGDAAFCTIDGENGDEFGCCGESRQSTDCFANDVVTDTPTVPFPSWLIAVIVVVIVVVLVAVILIIVHFTGGFEKKKKPQKGPPGLQKDLEDPLMDEDDESTQDDPNEGEMKTAAAKSLVGEIVNAQVPNSRDSETNNSNDSTTDSELAPVADVTSTGAAELISSIISAIDDVDVNDEGATNTASEIAGSEARAADDDEVTPITHATNALIEQVLNDADGETAETSSQRSDMDDETVTVSESTAENGPSTTVDTSDVVLQDDDDNNRQDYNKHRDAAYK
jgi:hypothetical protein